MNQKIRLNTFETNSSSTHSCCLCSDEEFNNWKSGDLYYNEWDEKFITKEEVDKKWDEFKKSEDYKSEINYHDDEEDLYYDWMRDNGYKSYEDFGENFESDVTTRKINGQTIHSICYYGYDY